MGAVISALVYIIFQLCGLSCSFVFLRDKAFSLRLLSGSVLGSVLFQWLPVLYAFVFGFTLTSHWLALGTVLILSAAVWIKGRLSLGDFNGFKRKPKAAVWITAGLAYSIFCFLAVHSFREVDGAVYSSQCTYGDMSMHLGFITSIAGQGTFPPEYSILPGTLLSYPFLSDSISSSLLVLGAPLRFAYLYPMFFAGAQVVGGFVLFMSLWLKNKWKIAAAVVFFFFNGGFGFAYFMPNGGESDNFTRIFTSFYTTPTNYLEGNIRWVNVIVDMLVPQRATLFGWAVLFTAMSLLYGAIRDGNRRCFIFAGILGGALPMIHTHSFLALGLVSAGWLLGEMADRGFPNFNWRIAKGVLVAFPLVLAVLQLFLKDGREADWLPAVALSVVAAPAAGAVLLMVRKKSLRGLIPQWGLYLLLVLLLALPQLILWTFRQAQGDAFVRGHFNWANQGENYLWFYVKNIGVLALLYLPAVLLAKKRILKTIFPVFIIMILSELVVFQPNEYDNNKLIYIAYLLVCGLAADFFAETLCRIKSLGLRRAAASAVLVFCTLSAVLTMGREVVADYILFGREHVEAAEYIAANADPRATVLTDNRHNNSVAALTGRNIVCGSGSYLFFHGLDYAEQEEAVRKMYESPSEELFEKYKVDYVEISDYELGSYEVDEAYFEYRFPTVYENSSLRIYRVKGK